MIIQESAVIITDSQEMMGQVKNLIQDEAPNVFSLIRDISPTRIDIDEGFLIEINYNEKENFFDRLYKILGDSGVMFEASIDDMYDAPCTEVVFFIAGKLYYLVFEGTEDIVIGDIADWFKKWKIYITEKMIEKLNSLGITGSFIIGNPEDIEGIDVIDVLDDSDTDYTDHIYRAEDKCLLGDLISALTDSGINISRIDFSCDIDIADTARTRFENLFLEEWEKVEASKFESVEKWRAWKGDEETRKRVHTFPGNEGFSAEIEDLAIDVSDGRWCEPDTDALKNTLCRFKNEYPDITFFGYIGYESIDEHGSEIIEFAVSSAEIILYEIPTDILYPSIGEGLSKAINNEIFWSRFFELLEWYEEDEDWDEDDILYRDWINVKNVLKLLYKYSSWLPEDTCHKYIDLVHEHNAGNREELENLLLELQKQKL